MEHDAEAGQIEHDFALLRLSRFLPVGTRQGQPQAHRAHPLRRQHNLASRGFPGALSRAQRHAWRHQPLLGDEDDALPGNDLPSLDLDREVDGRGLSGAKREDDARLRARRGEVVVIDEVLGQERVVAEPIGHLTRHDQMGAAFLQDLVHETRHPRQVCVLGLPFRALDEWERTRRVAIAARGGRSTT